jgi:hypothetical protein
LKSVLERNPFNQIKYFVIYIADKLKKYILYSFAFSPSAQQNIEKGKKDDIFDEKKTDNFFLVIEKWNI